MSLRNVSAGQVADETLPAENILQTILPVHEALLATGNEVRSTFEVGPVTAIRGLRRWTRHNSSLPLALVWTS